MGYIRISINIFGLGEPNNDGVLNRGKARAFLQHCLELQKKLYFLLQVTSGSSCRETDMAVTQVCKTSAACRNVFITNGQSFIALLYNKVRSAQERRERPVARFLDKVTAGILMCYASIIRQLEALIVSEMVLENDKERQKNINSTVHREAVFSIDGDNFGAEVLRK